MYIYETAVVKMFLNSISLYQCRHVIVPGLVFRWCPSSYSWHFICLVCHSHIFCTCLLKTSGSWRTYLV